MSEYTHYVYYKHVLITVLRLLKYKACKHNVSEFILYNTARHCLQIYTKAMGCVSKLLCRALAHRSCPHTPKRFLSTHPTIGFSRRIIPTLV